jgi:hypothetical protein
MYLFRLVLCGSIAAHAAYAWTNRAAAGEAVANYTPSIVFPIIILALVAFKKRGALFAVLAVDFLISLGWYKTFVFIPLIPFVGLLLAAFTPRQAFQRGGVPAGEGGDER